jgi:DNA-binding HxlR family transcriptional regulator
MADEIITNNTCNTGCPVQATAEIIERKWATLIIRDLLTGKKRFSQLERSLVSISPKILSERLRELEAKQLITRSVYPTVPPTTDYELTVLGRELETVIRAMQDFGSLLLQTSQHEQT